jgi:acylphosphatase
MEVVISYTKGPIFALSEVLSMGKICRKHVFISGRVQGVGFRWYTRQHAASLGLAGWVRNLPGGKVEAVFQGEESLVGAMVEWCYIGAPSARVRSVIVDEEPVIGEETGFSVK